LCSGVCPFFSGRPLAFTSRRHTGCLTFHSSSSPRRWVRAERVHTARAGGCGFPEPRAVFLLLGLTAACCESPAHQVGRLDILFAARHPAGGCVPNTCTPPRRAVARYYFRGLCPFFVGQPLAVASRRHTRWAGLTCSFELVTPPVGARRTRAHRPGGPLRAIISAGCVTLLGPTAGFFELAAPPGGRSSLWKFSRHPEGGYEEVRRRSPERADCAVVA